ncbi:MAG TPA: DUF5701 family protein [Candidatus Dojkabacteria bacterium]|nr:DUF5701 family protein [Candidatus Dojkabacteria bacterium]
MFNYSEEFDHQVNNLISKGYPQLAQQTEEQFVSSLIPLKEKLASFDLKEKDLENGYLPFIVVVQINNVNLEKLVALIQKDGKSGVTKLFPLQTKDFQTVNETEIPNTRAYLLIDIDRGKETLNIAPNAAMKIIKESHRSPLTIEEGVAIVTHYPEYLMKNNCFSLLASRHPGDKRVPAIWINAQKQANLGWCWDGNPHTWLGSASCRHRIG